MQFAVVAHRTSETDDALAGAAASLGLPAAVLSPRDALRTLEPGDIALGRLDVRDELDGVERGTEDSGSSWRPGSCCSILRPHSSPLTTSF